MIDAYLDSTRMIDLKAARAEPDAWRAALARKGAGEAFDELLAADERWRALVPRVDELRSRTKLKGKPTPEQLEELQRVKEELRAAEEELAAAEAARDEALAHVPNPPHESAPDGDTEDDAVELRRFGEPPALAEPKEASEIGRFELERAARLSGLALRLPRRRHRPARARALPLRARSRRGRRASRPVLPPVLVREEAMVGTGFFPTEKSNIYELEQDGLFLTGTSEVALAAMHMTEILEADELPLRYAGFSTCFRREAGAAGKDTRGMFRVHQFNKVEMFVFTTPEDAWAEHERMVALEEDLAPAARPPVPRRQRRRRRPRRSGSEEDRHRGVVPEPGALPRGDVLLEHDRLPGAPARHPLPRRVGPRDAAHPERHRRHRPRRARDPRELPGRGARRAAAVRGP